MKLRHDDDPDDLEDVTARRSKWGLSRDVSLADLVTIGTVVCSVAWMLAVQGNKIDTNSRDITDVRQWIQNRSREDRADRENTDTRLRSIEEKLDTLIGEVDGNKGRSRRNQ